jgi:dihydrodipicolinate synthase/N-acetylneuraminate lyase
VTRDDPKLADVWSRLRAGRTPHGIAAALLPYTEEGRIGWKSFEGHVRGIRAAGLDVAVNMDTGFGDLLGPGEREAVLDAARRALGPDTPLYAGAHADDMADPEPSYRSSIERILRRGATPVLFQCPQMHAMSAKERAALYARITGIAGGGAIAFELSRRFSPRGEIWDEESFRRILEIPSVLGAKHSSLDRATELRRLAERDRLRPEFRIYTGNDLAIDMIAYGSDYLLGLAAFAPGRFASRDAAFARSSLELLQLDDALQHLGNVAFREPVPAYKHSAAMFLHLIGDLECDAIHPRAPRRPQTDRILLLDCALRLGLVDDPDRVRRERVEPFLP